MKKTKTLPFVEMPGKDYEILIKKNTALVYQSTIEPEIEFENGEIKDSLNDSFVEIRMVPSSHGFFYIYSSFTNRFWSTRSLDEANAILKSELKYCNRFMKVINDSEREESIDKFLKQTEPLLKSAQDIIRGDSSNNN